jgi:predicted O-methyltransferase YrrM
LPLLREGGLVLADNTLPHHVLTGEEFGTTLYNKAVAEIPELTSVIIPVLRHEDFDGLTVSIKRELNS